MGSVQLKKMEKPRSSSNLIRLSLILGGVFLILILLLSEINIFIFSKSYNSASILGNILSNKSNKNATLGSAYVKNILSISDMEDLLSKKQVTPRSIIPRWSSSKVDRQMLYAKSEIDNAQIVTIDEELYKPIFRNLSKFKRSYELMEKTLKVYVYKEGEKPIFHEPFITGIYASEGWFMKQMEENKKFVVNDPQKAHLFYISLSSVNLRFKLYTASEKADSKSYTNMTMYLKSYINLISSKYPFWNRTNGADHFLAGCHDWATMVTEQSIMKTTLRALCTADPGRGFEIGKNISLPATLIKHKKYPQLNLGGKSAHERTTLAFYAGKMHGYFRPILVKYWQNKDPDMAISGLIKKNKTLENPAMESHIYIDYMKKSKYCICPKGYEVWSTRVMESILYRCVPVMISDNYVPPFFQVLNWSEFSVILPEKDVPKLKQVFMDIPQWRYLELERGVREVRRHFLWNKKPIKYDLFHMILHSFWFSRLYN